MQTFNYDMSIQAPSESEADTKMKALTLLASKLNSKELKKLAEVVENEPLKLALAKKAMGL